MQIFKPFIFLAFTVICTSASFCQDKIYLGIGTQSGKITNINADVIKFINAKNVPSQVSVKDVFLLFNDKGGYLVPYRIDFNDGRTKNIVNGFINPPSAQRLTDYIYTIDGKLVHGFVVKENKKTFTINDNGNKYDLDKTRVVAIIYKDGHHNLISPVITVADILWTVFEEETKNDNTAKAEPVKTDFVKSDPVRTEPVKTEPIKTDLSKTDVVKTAPPPVKPVETLKKEETAQPKKDPPSTKTDPAKDTNVPAPPPAPQPALKFEDLAKNVSRAEFEKKALEKTMQLNQYLKVLCNKASEYEERNKAVDLAVTLFINEDATVQTSSLNSENRTTYKIKKYLQAIKLYNYDKVEIEWTKLQYVSNLKKAPDGNYYGTISFEQVFKGYIDGKIAYEDITVKTGEVILKAYQKMVNGSTVEQWEVLLGDISVKSTKSL